MSKYWEAWSRYIHSYVDQELEISTIMTLLELDKVRTRKRLLDVGVGQGRVLYEVVRRCPVLDPVAVDIDVSVLKLHHTRLKVSAASAVQLPFQEQSFDFVMSTWVLQSIDEYQAVPEMVRVLKFGGRLIIEVPNEEGHEINLREILEPKVSARVAQKIHNIKNILIRENLRVLERRLLLRFRFASADEAWESLAPFVIRRDLEVVSTQGKWLLEKILQSTHGYFMQGSSVIMGVK